MTHAPSEALERIEALVREHVERYPDMEAVDLYKLLHQACTGPGHLLALPDAEQHLIDEARSAGLEVYEWEETVELLDEARGLARVHLRPYLRAGGALTRLFAAMAKTAEHFEPDRDLLAAAIARVLSLLEGDEFDVSFDRAEFRTVAGRAAREGFRPAAHSDGYNEAYHPAYRVVELAWLSEDADTDEP